VGSGGGVGSVGCAVGQRCGVVQEWRLRRAAGGVGRLREAGVGSVRSGNLRGVARRGARRGSVAAGVSVAQKIGAQQCVGVDSA